MTQFTRVPTMTVYRSVSGAAVLVGLQQQKGCKADDFFES